MLNPYLEQRLYSLPVQPVLVEIDPAQFAATLGQITGLNLETVFPTEASSPQIPR